MYIVYIVSLVLNWFSNLEFWRQKKLSKLGGCNLDKIQKNSSFSSWNRPLVSQLPSRKISDVVFKPWIRAGNTNTCQPMESRDWFILLYVSEQILLTLEMFHLPGLAWSSCLLDSAVLNRRDGEAGSPRPAQSWQWWPFFAVHNLVNDSQQFELCHYLSQDNFNQN